MTKKMKLDEIRGTIKKEGRRREKKRLKGQERKRGPNDRKTQKRK